MVFQIKVLELRNSFASHSWFRRNFSKITAFIALLWHINFTDTQNTWLKKYLLISLLAFTSGVQAQKIDSIYVNLYTDSLKRGTHNYINVDGLLSNGSYQPLDSTDIIFKSSDGKFFGNSLLIDKDFSKEKITIEVTCRKNPLLHKRFDMYIKTKPDNEQLKTEEELLNEMRNQRNRKKNKSNLAI